MPIWESLTFNGRLHPEELKWWQCSNTLLLTVFAALWKGSTFRAACLAIKDLLYEETCVHTVYKSATQEDRCALNEVVSAVCTDDIKSDLPLGGNIIA